MPSSSHNFFIVSFRNSFPLSETIRIGTPCRQIHDLKKALAKVSTILSSMAASSVYLEKASVITIIYFLPCTDLTFKGPNKSMWTRKFGSPTVGKGFNGEGIGFLPYISWHTAHLCKKFCTSYVRPGHQKPSSTQSIVLCLPL